MSVQHLPQLSDAQLVIAFQKENNNAAFDVLYKRYYRKVFLYCSKIIGDREEAQDITSEVFIKVYEKLNGLREAVTFQAWLFLIARNRSINVCVKRQRKNFICIDDICLPAEPQPDLQEYEEKEARIVQMYSAFQALPSEAQNLLKAKYCDGASIENLMERYQLSESAVKMRLARARHKAGECLAHAS